MAGFNREYRQDLQKMGIKGRDLARMRLKNERNPEVISIIVQVVSACGILLIVLFMGVILK